MLKLDDRLDKLADSCSEVQCQIQELTDLQMGKFIHTNAETANLL